MHSRRNFLRTTLGLAGAAALQSGPALARPTLAAAKPRLAFSTLGCPKWSLDTILKTAADSGYDAVEIRGLEGELDLSKRPEFNSPASLSATLRRFRDKKLSICDLGSSAQMHHADPVKRQKNLDEARRFIDMAQQLDCPFVRVFPDSLPKDQDREKTLDLISQGLLELGKHANGSKVQVLLESHGELVTTNYLTRIMGQAEHPHVGLIWDIFNMWVEGKEAPAAVHTALKKYIRHVHVKDARVTGNTHQYVLLGQGDAPLQEAITALRNDGYKGFYSFEWEKMWHPEIAEPELAIPDYPKAIRKYFT